jgi:hypothetical protein
MQQNNLLPDFCVQTICKRQKKYSQDDQWNCVGLKTYFMTKKFQLLLRQYLICIKPETAFSEHLSFNTKTFAIRNVFLATNDHQESF